MIKPYDFMGMPSLVLETVTELPYFVRNKNYCDCTAILAVMLVIVILYLQ